MLPGAPVSVRTMVKLVRVPMLGPVVLVLSLVAGRLDRKPGLAEAGAPARLALHRMVPWFIVGFLIVPAVRSLGPIPASPLPAVKLATSLLTTVSMAALGLGVDVRVVARAGIRVTAAVTLSLAVLGMISYALIRMPGIALRRQREAIHDP